MDNIKNEGNQTTLEKVKTVFICTALIGLFFVEGAGYLLIGTLLVIVGCLFTKKGRAFLASLGSLDFSNWKEALAVIFGAYFLLIMVNLFSFDFSPGAEVADTFAPDEEGTDTEGAGGIILFSLGALIGTAILEEVVFRGYLLTRLIRVFGDGKIALFSIVMITSLVFGAGHYYQTGLDSFVQTTIFSILVSFIFIRFNFNLGYAIAIHVLNNAVFALVLFALA